MCYINGNYAILLIIICSGSILNKIQINVTLLFHYVILYYLKYILLKLKLKNLKDFLIAVSNP